MYTHNYSGLHRRIPHNHRLHFLILILCFQGFTSPLCHISARSLYRNWYPVTPCIQSATSLHVGSLRPTPSGTPSSICWPCGLSGRPYIMLQPTWEQGCRAQLQQTVVPLTHTTRNPEQNVAVLETSKPSVKQHNVIMLSLLFYWWSINVIPVDS